jgi:hypothetical protein
MPNVGLEMRRIKDLSVEEWNILSQKFGYLMLELGYDKKRVLESKTHKWSDGIKKYEWIEFCRMCKLKDLELVPPDVPNKEGYIGCRWYSLWFSTKGPEEELFVPRELDMRPATGWGSYFFKDRESVVLEKIEMLFLGPFRTYYKCLSPVTRNFRTEAERKESEENGFALAVLMDHQLRSAVFPICQR